MSDRPRRASNSVQTPLSPARNQAVKSAIEPLNGEDRFSAWNQVFERLPLSERDYLFHLARQQGHLSHNQLHPFVKSKDSGSESTGISRLLAGQIKELEPAQIQQAVCTDRDLDKTQ